MAQREKPPFRADHVGSLLRPESLLKARDDHAAGTIDDEALNAVEDEAIREVAAMLEYNDERSGTFEPLRFVPKGKQVVLGLVTTKRPELEDKDLLKRRIEEASK